VLAAQPPRRSMAKSVYSPWKGNSRAMRAKGGIWKEKNDHT
jgi:hypothetical protein